MEHKAPSDSLDDVQDANKATSRYLPSAAVSLKFLAMSTTKTSSLIYMNRIIY